MSDVSVLAGVCVLIALSAGAAGAQAPSAGSLQTAPLPLAGAVVTRPQNGLSLVTRSSSAPADRGVWRAVGTPSAPLRFDQSLVGSARLGISPPQVSNAIVARDARSAVQSTSLRHRGPGVALMIVGAAGVITGLLLDESVVTVAGAGVGLVGLYLYLR